MTYQDLEATCTCHEMGLCPTCIAEIKELKKGRQNPSEGLLSKIRHQPAIAEYKPLTLKSFQKMAELISKQQKEFKYFIEWNAWFVLNLDEYLFIMFCKSNEEVVGGIEAITKINERIDRLKKEGKL